MNNGICQFTKKEYDCKNCDGYEEDHCNEGSFTIHMCQSVKGPVFLDNKTQWKRMAKYITDDDGHKMSPKQIRLEFFEMYQEGVECIPIGACDRFCFKTGCVGHKNKESEK